LICEPCDRRGIGASQAVACETALTVGTKSAADVEWQHHLATLLDRVDRLDLPVAGVTAPAYIQNSAYSAISKLL